MAEQPLVLIVDDQEEIVSALAMVLAALPLQVRTETNPKEALRFLREAAPPAVIVTDYKMPGMDGVAFLSQAVRLAPQAKCVMLTGTADSFAVDSGRSPSMRYIVLSKPIEPDLFLKIIAKMAMPT